MLNSHPWVSRPFVKDAVARRKELGTQSPGAQLVIALADFFKTTMPSNPPRRGKRLDTRWGEFGLLAAQYFAPLQFGAPIPSSLRDAWGRIDHAILLYVYARGVDTLSQDEIATYKLVGDELEVAPTSTLSDWHTKGMQKLAEALVVRDQFLTKEQRHPHPRRKLSKVVLLLFLLILASLLTWTGFTARRVYDLSNLIRQDVSELREQVTGSPNLATAKAVEPLLERLRQDFDALKMEAKPFIWLCPWLNWLPVYGEDIASAPDLLDMADALLSSADQSYQALSPILEAYEKDPTNLDPAVLVGLLNQAQPQLIQARLKLNEAVDARTRLDAHQLSPRVSDLFMEDVDKVIALMDDGLTLAVEIPRVFGATSEGPKTYLLLAQNEDELRPTGGFITAAGTLLLQDGNILNLTFRNSGDYDNWIRPYPAAPWQLQQYMDSPVLIFRDANWFTDYRTAALYAEYLYSYADNHSVDGVIAFDQHMLVEILRLTGPITLEGEITPIDANNVLTYMRGAKAHRPSNLTRSEWDTKMFIKNIALVLVGKILGGDIPLEQLARVAVKALDEHHLLIQMDNQTLTQLLVRHGWDGALRPLESDFLMVVDSNIGFNKTNAVVYTNLSYDVDLSEPSAPTSSLVVSHQNTAAEISSCNHTEKVEVPGEEDYPITDCYWDYLRVYTPANTELLGASVQTVPAEWMILGQTVPPQVDILDEEIEGIRSFGTLKVVPGGESLSTSFRFALPASVISLSDTGQLTYHLKIQKQPGTLGVPITIRIHLPNGATIQAIPSKAVIQDQNILLQTTLTTDLELEFIFLFS